ncbi:MAG: glycosyltransferase family 4 protein, partial [Planctomycetales bacterium]|nr:glycosyltransferase family 4 protein [Planctomycetales bacterium]
HDAKIPIVSLIHELPNSYEPEDFQLIEAVSEKIVFPSRFVFDAAHAFERIPESKTTILPQGLLDEGFGTRFNRDQAKQDLAEELGIPIDAKVVLACGTIDLRKGIDHFVRAAQAFFLHHASSVETHFVWLGGGPQHKHTPYHYVAMDLERSQIQDRVHFVGERSNVEPYFMAADAALMMSREDPFPCVVHEAMACGLPMITFASAGGAPEALADGAGIVVPYGDSNAVAQELHRLTIDGEYRDKISKRAKDRVRSVYDFRAYARQVAALLEAAAGVSLDFPTERRQKHAA